MICQHQLQKASRPSDITVEYPSPCGQCSLCLAPRNKQTPKVYRNPLECDSCHTIHHIETDCPDIQF